MIKWKLLRINRILLKVERYLLLLMIGIGITLMLILSAGGVTGDLSWIAFSLNIILLLIIVFLFFFQLILLLVYRLFSRRTIVKYILVIVLYVIGVFISSFLLVASLDRSALDRQLDLELREYRMDEEVDVEINQSDTI